jgi:hypothetical protein
VRETSSFRVFDPSVVKQNGKEFRFTCAMFRIHPRSADFTARGMGMFIPRVVQSALQSAKPTRRGY